MSNPLNQSDDGLRPAAFPVQQPSVKHLAITVTFLVRDFLRKALKRGY
jgi:hypothetical protein